MVLHWRRRIPLLLLSLLCPSFSSAHSFENTAIVRTIDLGGSLVHVTTTYAVRALEDGAAVYTLALAGREHERTSWLEAKIKGEQSILPMESGGFDAESGVYLYSVELPKALKTNGTANLVVETIETHATYPWPEEAAQKDGQALKYESDLFVASPYKTSVERIKVKSPSPNVISYSTPEGLDEFTMDVPVTKSGATITYGPFSSVPVTADADFLKSKQKKVAVHYDYDHPVLEVTKLKRSAEISHWGANLNIEDNINLHNAGPKLKGHFSRLEHQASNFFGRLPPHILPSVSLHLPPNIRSPYYYDLIGNVSTSRLRVGNLPAQPFSLLEMRPRYPLLGGWNYSFTLGWDSPLADYAGYDKSTGNYMIGVPLMTLIPGAVVDEAEIQIILPEGATYLRQNTHCVLDTVGRPAIVLEYKDLTTRHAGTIYVTYKVPLSAHLKKPLAVATAFMTLFVLGFAAKRMDVRIQKK
ncbi:oligosaccharyl transferase alpha subunit [Fomitopsis serialis]|uniref:oligosaccharyl transferase alpha subunit n=1 Tax=Fomitopsis serialis TaxID=139415 RepID=UPI0020088B30|nr:oligosaccharyl transferase alpha subunit [Neoantrodia serialis]KAH9938268.1 oligosaccharyl transferase alpha subunit [Neoantrodia serialis]